MDNRGSVVEDGIEHLHLVHPGGIILGAVHRRAAARADAMRLVRIGVTRRALVLVPAKQMRVPDPARGFSHTLIPFSCLLWYSVAQSAGNGQ